MLRDGFQACPVESGGVAPAPRWEGSLVVAALAVHVVDVGLDLCVLAIFWAHEQWSFFIGSACVVLWAWLVASLYVVFGGETTPAGDIDDEPSGGVASAAAAVPRFMQSFVQVRIFAEAYSCIFRGGDTDYFHTLRLMEAILQSAPNAVLQLYALVYWVGNPNREAVTIDANGLIDVDADRGVDGAATLLRFSVFASFVSVGLGLAMWEQKVQCRTSSLYVASVAVMRLFEIASRSLTLAVFAGVTHPYGFGWVLLLDYLMILVMIVQHRSVQLTYGLVVALPLVLVSLEPLVWRREDHAVPKDSYYAVRVLEFVILWIVITQRQPDAVGSSGAIWFGCETLALLCTLGLYATLPCVWLAARKHELSRDVAEWRDDDAREGLAQEDGSYSGSDMSGETRSDEEMLAGNTGDTQPGE